MTDPSLLEPSIALAAYAEPLAANRRVLVFGNALAALSLQLLERGARSVHVCDPDALRVSEANQRNRSTQISFSTLADSDLAVRDAAFELALVDCLSDFDAPTLLKKARRALVPRGVALAACPNPEAAHPLIPRKIRGASALDYYALYDAVAAEFEHVRMLGQTPFVGYAIADFSASGEPEPALDTSFVPGGAEEPDWFVAMAADHEVRLDEFAVIQLPTHRLLESIGQKPAKPAQSQADPRELSRLQAWANELEARAATADERADLAEAELDVLRSSIETQSAQLNTQSAQLKAQSAQLNTQGAKLTAQATQLNAQAIQLGVQTTQLNAQATQLGVQTTQLNAQTTQLNAQATQLNAQTGKLDAQSSKLEELRERLEANAKAQEALKHQHDRDLEAKQAEFAQAQLAESTQRLGEVIEEDGRDELTELERQLVDRGGEVRRLEQALRTTERTGRELVRELERRGAEATRITTAELERALAEREADLQAAAWTIESLTLRLDLSDKAAAPPSLAVSDAEAR